MAFLCVLHTNIFLLVSFTLLMNEPYEPFKSPHINKLSILTKNANSNNAERNRQFHHTRHSQRGTLTSRLNCHCTIQYSSPWHIKHRLSLMQSSYVDMDMKLLSQIKPSRPRYLSFVSNPALSPQPRVNHNVAKSNQAIIRWLDSQRNKITEFSSN